MSRRKVTEVAREVKRALRREWPDTDWSVTSAKFTDGIRYISIRWDDHPDGIDVQQFVARDVQTDGYPIDVNYKTF